MQMIAFQCIQTKYAPVETPTMCLIEGIVRLVSHTRIAFECCYLVKSCSDASFKKQKCWYQYVSDFDKCRIIAYWNCSLSYHNITDHAGRDPKNVRRIWNQWVQDGNTERCVRSRRPSITSSREDRHVTRKALIYHAATSRGLSHELGSFARQQVSARRLLQHRLSARRALTLLQRQERLQW
ncbi:HTH_Tnp_Tc3_2 domain-containing protein [Trichonephila clavipes]|nr:HTH_Tnp_Tc3_2 domain-containing protein [Trichonephila clavipes]